MPIINRHPTSAPWIPPLWVLAMMALGTIGCAGTAAAATSATIATGDLMIMSVVVPGTTSTSAA